jgi:hypothetical protein
MHLQGMERVVLVVHVILQYVIGGGRGRNEAEREGKDGYGLLA